MNLQFSLPDDEAERSAELLRLFGALMMDCRSRAIQGAANLLASTEDRAAMGTIFREPYDAVAALTPEQQKQVLELVAARVDFFAKDVLALLGSTLPICDNKSAALSVHMNVYKGKARNKLVHHDELSRSSKTYFPQNWPIWKNDQQLRELTQTEFEFEIRQFLKKGRVNYDMIVLCAEEINGDRRYAAQCIRTGLERMFFSGDIEIGTVSPDTNTFIAWKGSPLGKALRAQAVAGSAPEDERDCAYWLVWKKDVTQYEN